MSFMSHQYGASIGLGDAWRKVKVRHAARRSPFARVAGPLGFAEGPVWNGEHVLFTDIPSDQILAFDPRTGS